jgi:trans-AT polyketide synthase/acyltransferase/oxidoreductase domain-containing protein
VADLLIRRGVARIEASAFMALTPAVVRYAASGLTVDAEGASRGAPRVREDLPPEVARRFMAPAPAEMLRALVADGLLTAAEAELARGSPVAEDITVEADSGGHTDNQALTALLPTILSLRDELARSAGYARPIRVGAAGGLGTPGAVAAAFALGAAYVLTGSVNQAAVESGLSAGAGDARAGRPRGRDHGARGRHVRARREGPGAEARDDVRGARAKLYDAYVTYPSLDGHPRGGAGAAGARRAARDLRRDLGRHQDLLAEARPGRGRPAARPTRSGKMALVFRWYLGKASKWAIDGEPSRRADYQVWCGPAMGAFNAWARGSFLAEPPNRTVVQIGLNLLEGAAVVTRAQQLRSYGVAVPPGAFDFRPRPWPDGAPEAPTRLPFVPTR